MDNYNFYVSGGYKFLFTFLLISKKSFDYFNDTEFKFYLWFIVISFIITFLNVSSLYGYTFKNFTASMFNVMTFMTTTGYTLYDYSTWPALFHS